MQDGGITVTRRGAQGNGVLLESLGNTAPVENAFTLGEMRRPLLLRNAINAIGAPRSASMNFAPFRRGFVL